MRMKLIRLYLNVRKKLKKVVKIKSFFKIL